MKTFIFDVDGVLVDSPHEQAWGETLKTLVETDWAEEGAASAYHPEDYTSGFYQFVVAGKPRNDGARAMLAAFGLPMDDAHVALLCRRKQAMIADLIDRGEFRAYADAVGFLLRVMEAGGKVAAASSSKNANAMMARVHVEPYLHGRPLDGVTCETTLLDVLAANVSGRDIHPGKPHPKLFLTAAEEAGADPADCVVIEDAPSGVKAAKAGGMKAIGLARHNDEELLKAAGADLVVTTLGALNPNDI
ncbi:MAG TPA: HAD-IA family hydrolase [Armatimonadota bacterium]